MTQANPLAAWREPAAPVMFGDRLSEIRPMIDDASRPSEAATPDRLARGAAQRDDIASLLHKISGIDVPTARPARETLRELLYTPGFLALLKTEAPQQTEILGKFFSSSGDASIE